MNSLHAEHSFPPVAEVLAQPYRTEGPECSFSACQTVQFPISATKWVRDEPRRHACHVPPAIRYQTRHAQCLEMLDAWREQVPHGWVTGDDELGRHTRFRHELRERGERYVLGVPCTTTIRDLEAPLPAYSGRGRRPKAPWQSVTAWRQALPGETWTR